MEQPKTTEPSFLCWTDGSGETDLLMLEDTCNRRRAAANANMRTSAIGVGAFLLLECQTETFLWFPRETSDEYHKVCP